MRPMIAWLRRLRPITVLVVSGAIGVVYSFPGYMNYDATAQLAQAMRGKYGDWHAPTMAWYWHRLDHVLHGPTLMLVLQIGLFLWGAYSVFSTRFSSKVAAWLASALFLFPPVFVVLTVVWKDAQMAAWLMCGFALALRPSRGARVTGIAMLVLGAAVRDNGVAALPPLVLVIAAAWGMRRRLAIVAAGFALFVAISGAAITLNRVLTFGHDYAWYQANAIHDIAGTLCFSDPLTDDEIETELAGIELRQHDHLQQKLCAQYNPTWWFPLSMNPDSMFVSGRPGTSQRLAIKAAYWRVVLGHPRAFLHHRWHVMAVLLGLGTDIPAEPVCQTFVGNDIQFKPIGYRASLSPLQHALGRAFTWLTTLPLLLWRPWAYAVVGVFVFGFALRRRDGLVMSLIGAGWCYELGYAIGAAGTPYRYSQWMVLCVVAATMIVIGDRVRDGRRALQANADAATRERTDEER
jgi:hypothetical protein